MITDNWKLELKKALRTEKDLETYFETPFSKTPFPILLPRRLAEKIKLQGLDGPLGRQFLPHGRENETAGFQDPIGDKVHSPVKGLVHRYGNRALYFPTKACPVICRYCFRKNELIEDAELFRSEKDEVRKYLQSHTEINEIILSGGDPLTLTNEKLKSEILFLGEFTHIRFLRIHTRFPVILPERIDVGFLELMALAKERFDMVNFVVHLNHSSELDEQVSKVLKNVQTSGARTLCQSVLLKGVNDDPKELVHLFIELAAQDIRPYYLHHPDQVRGGLHFWLSLEEGRRIFNEIRQETPGWAIPQYVIDLPHGKGKVQAFNPESIEFGGSLIDRFNQPQDYSSP